MKAVSKGECEKTYTHYSQARDLLLERLGMVCSYCEMNISNSPEVEHVIPKSKDPAKELDWDNFLISCKYCNVNKSDINDSREDYYFPDDDNTARLFVFTRNTVTVNGDLNADQKIIAKNVIELTHIDRDREAVEKLKLKDIRWRARNENWTIAEETLQDYREFLESITYYPEEERLKQIDIQARIIGRLATSFTSSWLQIFSDYPEVSAEIIKRTKGIDKNCYKDGKPSNFVKGRI